MRFILQKAVLLLDYMITAWHGLVTTEIYFFVDILLIEYI